MTYFPPPDPAPWKRATPGETGFDPDGVAAAARHASEHETPWSRDLGRMVADDFEERPPWNETLGPVRPRGGPNGLLLRNGLVVAEWGDTTRVDMTFSVAKSYLSILAGLAWDRGLIGDPHEKVRLRVDDGGFDPPHNDAITWHLVQGPMGMSLDPLLGTLRWTPAPDQLGTKDVHIQLLDSAGASTGQDYTISVRGASGIRSRPSAARCRSSPSGCATSVARWPIDRRPLTVSRTWFWPPRQVLAVST